MFERIFDFIAGFWNVLRPWVVVNDFEGGVILRSTGKTRADRFGRFRFAGLGPGRHELVATAWHSDSDLRTVRQTVNLGVESGELILLVDHR